MTHLSLSIAFLAGLVSFLSPCILPILPGFLAFLAGSGTQTASTAPGTTAHTLPTSRFPTFFGALAFVLGFSVVFALLGVLLNTLLSNVAYDALIWTGRIGGLIIIFFGLYLTGLFKIPFLEREYKIHPTRRFSSKYLTAFVFGAAFAAGWTPCVGAVLGSILGLAATQPGSAFALLLTYSLGLGLPFLAVGFFAEGAVSWLRRYRTALRYTTIIFGVFLIIIGVLAFFGQLGRIASFDFVTRLLG